MKQIQKLIKQSLYYSVFVFAGMMLLSVSGQAGAPGPDIYAAKDVTNPRIDVSGENPTHDPIRMTPDKSELLNLDRNVASVIVGNPNHVSILADNPRTLILVARAPGATHFVALDENGDVVMERHVIVASPKKNYVRVRRSCSTAEGACQATRVYYCPDMCHEIMIGSEEGGGDAGGAGGGESETAQASAAGAQDALNEELDNSSSE